MRFQRVWSCINRHREVAAAPVATRVIIRVGIHGEALFGSTEPESRISICQNVLMIAGEEGTATVIAPDPTFPENLSNSFAWKCLIHEKFKLQSILVIDADEYDAIVTQ